MKKTNQYQQKEPIGQVFNTDNLKPLKSMLIEKTYKQPFTQVKITK